MNEDRKASEYISGSRRLRPEEIAFEDEMLIIGNRLNFYMPLYFDPVEVFGEKMRLEDGEGYINVYANYDLDNECVCITMKNGTAIICFPPKKKRPFKGKWSSTTTAPILCKPY